MEIEEERDGYDEQTEQLMEESEYDVEATEENLSEYEGKLLKITEEMLLVEIEERKIKRVKQTKKKETSASLKKITGKITRQKK